MFNLNQNSASYAQINPSTTLSIKRLPIKSLMWLICALLFGTIYIWTLSLTHVQHVVLSGSWNTISPQQIEAWLLRWKKEHPWTSMHQLPQKLAINFPALAEIDITRPQLNQLMITLKERQPTVQMNLTWLGDDEGNIWPTGDIITLQAIPQLYGKLPILKKRWKTLLAEKQQTDCHQLHSSHPICQPDFSKAKPT